MSSPRLLDLAADPRLRAVLVSHARRGMRVQLALRGVLVAFALGTAIFVPPAHARRALFLAVACYAVAALASSVWLRRGGLPALRYGWLALFGDVAALVVFMLIAGLSAQESWTADLLMNGFFLIPVLGATQLRPGVCFAVVAVTDVAYLGAGLATQDANEAPLAYVLMGVFALTGLSAGAVALSYVQRSRVLTIGSLVAAREQLLGELVDLEGRERRRLSEHLHDGALQYVLAARMDLEDVRDGTDPAALDRIDEALAQTSTLLRTTVGELYPAVLEQAGLAEALRQIAFTAAARGGFTASVTDAGWPAGTRTPADTLLFTAARELLGNVVKHAQAHTVEVWLALDDSAACVEVRDDGVGIGTGEFGRKLAAGHIGVASHRARVEAAGGSLTFAPGPGGGTVATVRVPVSPPGRGRPTSQPGTGQLVTSLPANRAQASVTNTAR